MPNTITIQAQDILTVLLRARTTKGAKIGYYTSYEATFEKKVVERLGLKPGMLLTIGIIKYSRRTK